MLRFFLFMKIISIFLSILLTSVKLSALEHGSTAHYPIGELGEIWQFPSDHLPVGMSVGDVHLAMWNTLNTRYIYHIHTNHQGLKGSLITTANVPTDLHSKLTLREEIIVELVLDMVRHPTLPRSLLALQEVGTEVYLELKRRLPEKMVIITAFPDDLANGDIFIYDKEKFDYVSLFSDCFQICPKNTYLTLTLQEKATGGIYRFIQSHVPGGPVASIPARDEWAENILINFDPSAVNIVMGDMNRSPDFFLKNLNDAAEDLGHDRHPFQNLWIPYPTHIDTYKRATWIDNFFIYTPELSSYVRVEKNPKNLGASVEKAASILLSLRSCPLETAFELRCQLAVHEFAVFQGSCGCWTDGQLKLALEGKEYVKCNLCQLFHEAAGIEGDEEEEVAARMEKEWIRENKQRLISDWSGEECIVIDQLDFAFGSDHSADKLETVMEIIDMARSLRMLGKTVVLVVHKCWHVSPKVWEELSEMLAFHKSNLIVQEYLTDDEEEWLLSKSDLSREEKDQFKRLTKGTPFAYVVLMELLGNETDAGRVGFQELSEEMMLHIEHMWSEVAGNEPSDVLSMLVEIARESVKIEDLAETSKFGYLLETGFIGVKDGNWIMPQIVKDFLLNFN